MAGFALGPLIGALIILVSRHIGLTLGGTTVTDLFNEATLPGWVLFFFYSAFSTFIMATFEEISLKDWQSFVHHQQKSRQPQVQQSRGSTSEEGQEGTEEGSREEESSDLLALLFLGFSVIAISIVTGSLEVRLGFVALRVLAAYC